MVLSKKKINSLKKNHPIKFLRLKYILYYFPFIMDDKLRFKKLLNFIENDFYDFYITCNYEQMLPFFDGMHSSIYLDNKCSINVQRFFEYFKI